MTQLLKRNCPTITKGAKIFCRVKAKGSRIAPTTNVISFELCAECLCAIFD
jgi:hypothetical protein